MQQDLAQAFALVTGASSGIGHAISSALAAGGTRVLLVGRSCERLATVLSQLGGAGAGHLAIDGDLTSTDFLANLAQRALQWSQERLSILVLCAGHHEPSRIEETSAASFDAAIATNLRAPFLLTGALLPSLRATRGQVVLVNSSVVNNPRAGTAAYAASKAGLRTFADCLRAEVGPDGVTVLSVYPGRTATPMQRDRYEREGLQYAPELLLQPSDVARAVVNAVGSSGEVTELHLRPLHKG